MGFFKKIRRAIKKVGRAVKKVATFLVGPVSSPFSTTQSIPQMQSEAGTQQLDGILLNFQGGSVPVPLVYGHRKIGGTRVFVSTNGTDNKYLYVAIVFCEGPIVGLSGRTPLHIDDTPVELTSTKHGVVAEPVSGPYKDRLKCQFFDGRNRPNSSAIHSVDYTDPEEPMNGSKDGVFADIDGSGGAPGWTVDHQLVGLAWYAMRFEWKKIQTQEDANNNPYKGIPDIKVNINGKVIFNAEHCTSNHGATTGTTYYEDVFASNGSQRAGLGKGIYGLNADSSSGSFGTNPANVLLDYLRNPLYGKGLPDNKIDFDSFRDAARVLQTTQQSVKTPTFDGAVPIFDCPIYIDTSQSIMNNIKIILQSFRAMLPYSNGKFKLVIEGPEDATIGSLNGYSGNINNVTTVKTFTNENIVGGITIERPDRSTRLNRVRITYTDGTVAGGTAEAIFPPDGADYDALLTEDNGEKLESSFAIPWCTFEPRAHLFAQILVRKSRNNTVISFATNLGASDLIPSNLITVVNEPFGINGPFRVVDMTMNADGLIVITAVEHQPSIYVQDLNNFNALQTEPVLNLPDPFSVQKVNTPVIVEPAHAFGRSDTLLIRWSATDDPFLDHYVVLIHRKGEPYTNIKEVGRTKDTKFIFENLTPGESYQGYVYVQNELGRRSDWLQPTFGHTTLLPTYTPSGSSVGTTVTSNTVTSSIGETEFKA
jgi:hypothetical protein